MVAYRIEGPSRAVLWLPDIDRWEKWDHRVENLARDPKLLAFVDGTFFDAAEIPGRSIADIPHPLVSDTMARAAGRGRPVAEIVFVHLNHTNRLLWDEAAVRQVTSRGLSVAREGARYPF